MKARVVTVPCSDWHQPVSALVPGSKDDALSVKIVMVAAGEPAEQHRHQLVGALARIQAINSALKRGYKFDDSSSQQYLSLFNEAIELLKEEMEVLSEIYR